jgi:hypothetical protein
MGCLSLAAAAAVVCCLPDVGAGLLRMLLCCLAAHWNCLLRSLIGLRSWQIREVDKWYSSCQVLDANALLLGCAAYRCCAVHAVR